MQKKNKIYIIITLIMFGIYGVVEYVKPKPINWVESYYNTHTYPYGTKILFECLEDIFIGKKITTQREPVYNTAGFKDYENEKINYLFISRLFDPDSLDMAALNAMVSQGNTAFITTGYFVDNRWEISLPEIIGFKPKSSEEYYDSVEINFTAPQFKRDVAYKFSGSDVTTYFDLNSDSRAEVLATNSAGNAVFIRFQYGEGFYFLATIPIAFTNYYIMEKSHRDFAFKCISYLPHQNVYWDEYYKQGRPGESNIFRVVFENPPLKWAYYIIIFSLLAYMIFESKRVQRVIPVIKPPVNSSVEFARSLSQLYIRNMDHRNIAMKKIDFFLDTLRDKYRIHTGTFTNETIDEIVNRSGVERNKVDEILRMINFVRHSGSIEALHLLTLNNMLQDFAKISNQK